MSASLNTPNKLALRAALSYSETRRTTVQVIFTYNCPTKAKAVVSKTRASVSTNVCKSQELREPQTPECMILIHRLEQFRDSSPIPAFPLPISSPPTERQKERVVIAASKEQTLSQR